MRVDKTLSDLRNLTENENVGETAKMAIKVIERLQKENLWLYGRLNQIGQLVEEGRGESERF